MTFRTSLRVLVCAGILAATGAPLLAQSDFTVAKSGPQTTTPPDSDVDFTITVTNNGPNAGAVTVSDPVPAGLTFVSVTQPAGFSCSGPGTGATSGTVTCNAAAMAPGSAIITVTFHIPPSTPSKTMFTNTVTVSSPADSDVTYTITVHNNGPSAVQKDRKSVV